MKKIKTGVPVAQGTQNRPHKRRTAIELDEETFVQIRELAIANATSFGAQLRLLVEWGLEAEEANKTTTNKTPAKRKY